MNHDVLIAASLFSFVSSITPGPNNMMMLASGVNFGFRRSVPHWLGICGGFTFMLCAVGLGLHTLLADHPALYDVLRYAGSAYLVWMAWRLATATEAPAVQDEDAHASEARPLGVWGAAAFQWVNPKAWVMAVTAMSAYLPARAQAIDVVTLALLFGVINLPCVACWAGGGAALRRFLQDPLRLRIFNISMALALLASLYPMLVT
ncbi:MAG: LysE family translocator [Betaproteobacteria bacterium]|nr:LysE family translocator [Betaproteobacteria bacterium]